MQSQDQINPNDPGASPSYPLPGSPGPSNPMDQPPGGEPTPEPKSTLEIAMVKGPMKFEGVDIYVVPKGYTGPLDKKEGDMGAEDTDSISIDSLEVQLDIDQAIESDAGLTFSAVTIAKSIVQEYQTNDGILRVYKPPEELKSILDHGENAPVTDEHPKLRRVTSRKQITGTIDNLTYLDSTGELKADIFISDSHLIADIKSGKKRDVSLGFNTKLDRTAGTIGDDIYDAIQTDMYLDHVAITKKGRCSLKQGCGITPETIANAATLTVSNESATPTPAIDSNVKGKMGIPPEIQAQLDSLIQEKRLGLINHLHTKLPKLARETLDAMDLDKLTETANLLKEGMDSHTSFGIPSFAKGKSIIDAAYAKLESK